MVNPKKKGVSGKKASYYEECATLSFIKDKNVLSCGQICPSERILPSFIEK